MSRKFTAAEAFAESDAWRDRFWAKVEKAGGDDCWLWIGPTNKAGYGYFRLGRTNHHASRVSLAIKLGRWPAKQEFACHTCDNPPCCNPSHLWTGSNQENIRDAASKGRTHKWGGARRGEGSPASKLTEQDAIAIIAAKGVRRMADVCEQYGVTSGAIGAIWAGRSWKHLPRPTENHHD